MEEFFNLKKMQIQCARFSHISKFDSFSHFIHLKLGPNNLYL
jgi:hypothetical protein